MTVILVQAVSAGRSKVVRDEDVVEAKASVPSAPAQKHRPEY